MFHRRQKRVRRRRLICALLICAMLIVFVNIFLLAYHDEQRGEEPMAFHPRPGTMGNKLWEKPFGKHMITLTSSENSYEFNNKTDETARLHFDKFILPQCEAQWVDEAAHGENYTRAMKLHQGRTAAIANATRPWYTYDDILHDTIDSKYYIHNSTLVSKNAKRNSSTPCDSLNIPFDPAKDAPCVQFARSLLDLAFAEWIRHPPTLNTTVEFHHTGVDIQGEQGRWGGKGAQVKLEALLPTHEQRTIKFALTLTPSPITEGAEAAAPVVFLVKVPQALFPTEPFAEVAAFHVDRRLGIGRVPPTFLLPLPLAAIGVAVTQLERRGVRLHGGIVRGNPSQGYAAWVTRDLLDFVQGGRRDALMNGTHSVWCSAQLRLTEVIPLLQSPLRVPYSKKAPGWHRWFNPLNNGTVKVPFGSLAALSQMAMFDFLIGNNDRSPNKNAFIVGGCRPCGKRELSDTPTANDKDGKDEKQMGRERRPSGLVPTLVHLDHGIAFFSWGKRHVNNPLSKPSVKMSFCIFYRPLVLRLWHMERELMGASRYVSHICNRTCNLTGKERDATRNDDVNDENEGCDEEGRPKENEETKGKKEGNAFYRSLRISVWASYLSANVSTLVSGPLGGVSVFRQCAKQMVRMLERVNVCLQQFPPQIVLIP